MGKELTFSDLWQEGMDDTWNKIAPFILGREGRGDAPQCQWDEDFEYGGRGSGKSSAISTWIMLALTNDHQKSAVVIRKVGSSIRKTCFKQMVKTIKKLKLQDFWDVNKTDLTITNKFTGQQIIFCGLDDEDKVRSITTDVGYFSICWFEEARQFNGMEEIRQARASILRGGLDEDETLPEEMSNAEFFTFLSYNPPKSSMEWINKEAKKPVKGRIVHKSTYLTMPRKWLGEGFIRTAEALKESDPEAYAHQYLGEVTGTGGRYFTNVLYRPISDEEIASFDYDNMGCDFGTKDPNIFERAYYNDETNQIFCFQEIDQKGENEGEPVNPDRYKDFADDILKSIPKARVDDIIYCDAQGKAEKAILEEQGLNVEYAPKQGANDRNHGYGWLRSKQLVIDPNRCPRLAEESQLFECKTLPDGTWTDFPGTKFDHAFDALRYAFWQEIQIEGDSTT